LWRCSRPAASEQRKNTRIIRVKVNIHCYVRLWGASERKLGKSLEKACSQIRQGARKIKVYKVKAFKILEKRARQSATKEAIPDTSGCFRKVCKQVGPSSN
jgi:hypothetical protein